jgi:hypothetical protein
MDKGQRDGLTGPDITNKIIYLFITPRVFYKLTYNDIDRAFTAALNMLLDDLNVSIDVALVNQETPYPQHEFKEFMSEDDRIKMDSLIQKIAASLGLDKRAVSSLVIRFMAVLAEDFPPESVSDNQ